MSLFQDRPDDLYCSSFNRYFFISSLVCRLLVPLKTDQELHRIGDLYCSSFSDFSLYLFSRHVRHFVIPSLFFFCCFFQIFSLSRQVRNFIVQGDLYCPSFSSSFSLSFLSQTDKSLCHVYDLVVLLLMGSLCMNFESSFFKTGQELYRTGRPLLFLFQQFFL